MTHEEVKRIFSTVFMGACCIDFENGDGTNECECPDSDCDNCRIAEAERMILEALEKQIPKKPINPIDEDGYGFRVFWNCPNCNIQSTNEDVLYCPICGQRIDWSEAE